MANTTGQKHGGRTKGTPNKTTAQIRESFQVFIENNIDKLQNDFEQLEPKDRIKTIIELTKFVLPTFRAMELQTTIEDKTKNINPIQIIFSDLDKNEDKENNQY
jgi:hypothetical protein